MHRDHVLFRPIAKGALALVLAGVAGNAAALDERFRDGDGNLVADPPRDESEWINTDTLVFAYTPVEDPSVYRDVWAGFLDHMERVTGKVVRFFPVQSNSAQLEAMRAGRLHVSGFNPGSVPVAVTCAGFVPFPMMAGNDGSFGYEMEIITYPGSGIDTVQDIRSGELTFTTQTSNSGFKAPSAILKSEFGMVAGVDFEPSFSGRHENSILGVANQDYEAASVANSVKGRMIARGAIDADAVEVIYQSQTFPTTAYGYVHNLHPDTADDVREAFATFEWEGTALAEEFGKNGEEQFVDITYQDEWAVIRTIDEANGVSYDCRSR